MHEARSNGYPMIHASGILAMRYRRQGATIIVVQDCIVTHLCMQCIKPEGNLQEREKRGGEREREREREKGRNRDPLHKYHPPHPPVVSVSLPGRGQAH